MKYYFKPENRIIDESELMNKYGTVTPVKGVGVFHLTSQPKTDPVGFILMPNGEYDPIEAD